MITCIKQHTPINEDATQFDIYCIPWVQIDPVHEYRVFVYQNHITAISQQHLYKQLYQSIDIERIPDTIALILRYFAEEIRIKITWTANYSYDFAIVDGQPYFIEMNCFGTGYAAGSSLFHWILDESILYNENPHQVEFRYTI